MNYYVLKSIEFGPEVLRRIYDRIDPSQYDAQPDPDRFTLREEIAHLADWEPIFRGRIENIRKQPGCKIVGESEEERAIANRYSEQDVAQSLATYTRERAITTELIRSMSSEDWSKFGVRDDYGPLTIEDISNLLVCHDMYHVEHAASFL